MSGRTRRASVATVVVVILGLSAVGVANAFGFSTSTRSPSECGDLTVTWQGGTGPYTLEILPTFGSQRIFNISSSAYSNGKGSYTTELALPSGQQFIVTMSDSTGFNAGGATSLLTIGSNSSASCNTTDPGTDFTFQLNDALQQCRTYGFSGYSGAVQPVTINGVVPGGTGFSIVAPKSSSNVYEWTVDVASGTSLMFVMTDAHGNFGGVSDVLTVSTSSDSSCLNSSSPSSTMSPIASSTSGSGGGGGGGVSGAVVGGAIAGVVVGLTALFLVGLFFWRKRQQQRRRQHLMDLSGDHSTTLLPGGRYDPTPFMLPAPTPSYESSIHSPHPPPSAGLSSFSNSNSGYGGGGDLGAAGAAGGGASSPSDASRRKTVTSTSSYNPARLILHTDAEDEYPAPDEHGLIELPPSYSENRRPMQGMGMGLGVANPGNGEGEREPGSLSPLEQARRNASNPKVPVLPPPPRAASPGGGGGGGGGGEGGSGLS